MKFYIDFDHTLYNTNLFITDMLNATAEYIFKNGDFTTYEENFNKMFPRLDILPIEQDKASVLQALKSNFKRPEETYLKIDYNIFALIDTFAKLFNCNSSSMKENINNLLANGQKYLYNDSIPFLTKLKQAGHEIYILSHERTDLDYQNTKIQGSSILQQNLVTATIVTKISKATLNAERYNDPLLTSVTYASNNKSNHIEVDYLNGIFLDDRTKDLEALYESVYSNELPNINKIRIFRIARPNGTYSNKPFSDNKYNNGIIKVSSPIEIFHYIKLDEAAL